MRGSDGPGARRDTVSNEKIMFSVRGDMMQAPGEPPRPTSLFSRLAWFVGLWLAGVAAVTAVAYAIRAVLL
jgi:hypothetical protein